MVNNPPRSVETIAHSMFEALARSFPVACSSDEFFYFPQVRLSEAKWSTWDCFSAEMVEEFVRRLSVWEDELDLISSYPSDLDMQIDIALLKKLARSVREQLSEVRFWEYQPTFYLSLLCIGLAEAMESEEPEAKYERIMGLPAFLDQACHNLHNVPVLFRNLGLDMLCDTRDYLVFLGKTLPELQSVFCALDRFESVLKKVSVRKDFLLPRDLLERIIRFHIHSEMDIQEVNQVLDREISQMSQVLDEEARHFVSGRFTGQYLQGCWQEAVRRLPAPAIGKDGPIGLYEDAVNTLAKHCLDQGLVSASQISSSPVRVAPMPSFLSTIRTASSYSFQPRQPPFGGVFYIVSNETHKAYLREYRMLSAHETYPGHHLLDSSRWSLPRYCRRAVEQPIFYEGWACFAEELMMRTGYFTGPADRLLLAKRRLWRAIRGKVDIGLQTGAMNISTAARYLRQTGISMEQAMSCARKYTLNAGYKVCYTLGLSRFLDLFDRYGSDNLKRFVHTVLAQGEINFMDLEKILKNKNN